MTTDALRSSYAATLRGEGYSPEAVARVAAALAWAERQKEAEAGAMQLVGEIHEIVDTIRELATWAPGSVGIPEMVRTIQLKLRALDRALVEIVRNRVHQP